MLTLALSAVAATHMWIGGVNTLVKVCKYYSDYSTSRYYYFYPATKIISYSSDCPAYITVEKK